LSINYFLGPLINIPAAPQLQHIINKPASSAIFTPIYTG
jgi:hypothetical protein